jgi:hypothetical protein
MRADVSQEMKVCSRCKEEVWIELFRVLSSGYRSSMCDTCEREYDRERRLKRSEEEPSSRSAT